MFTRLSALSFSLTAAIATAAPIIAETIGITMVISGLSMRRFVQIDYTEINLLQRMAALELVLFARAYACKNIANIAILVYSSKNAFAGALSPVAPGADHVIGLSCLQSDSHS
jgi:hypothetical protein